ncbi:MAG: hypothetical protein J6D18_00080 [Erysipelotrichaceae bacterium]|nr:hypothetical protein [Erysipelotrichaceae bacterium]
MELLILFFVICIIFYILGILLPYIIPVGIGLYIWYVLVVKRRISQEAHENLYYQQTPSSHPDAIDVEYTEHEETDGDNT